MPGNAIEQRERVLVVSSAVSGIVVQATRRSGAAADVVRDVAGMVERLRRTKYRAVLVDMDATEADTLEVVLNVRDVDQQVPIAVLAASWETANITALGMQSRTILVSKSRSVAALSDELLRLSLLDGASPEPAV